MSNPREPLPYSVRRFLLIAILLSNISAFSLLVTRGSTTGQSQSGQTQRQRSASHQSKPDEGLTPQRLQLFRQRHGNPSPQQQLDLARSEYQKRREEAHRMLQHPEVVEPSWESLGPANGAGRMSAIAFHPTIPGTLYVGADSGGVWKTTDSGASWTPLTDSIPSLEVGALAVAPSNPNVIYLGSGVTPVVGLSPAFRGIGLLKSTDGGATWLFPATVIAPRIFKMSVHPANSQDLVIATIRGGFRSTDGGQSWTETIPRRQDEFALEVFDVARDPSNSAILYATTYSHGIYPPRVLKSTDGGTSWTEKSMGLVAGHEIAIAVSPSNSQVLYASTGTNETNDVLSRIYKSTNGGNGWAELTSLATNPNPNISHFLGGHVYRHNTIVVSPADANLVLAGGVTYVRSTDGGASWQVPPFNGAVVHVDATEMRYQGSTLYIANDGGVWTTGDNGNTATDRNLGLVTRQYYSLSSDPVLRNRVFAGSQDNGTDRRPDAGGTSWDQILGGDGFDSGVDPNDPATLYATTQNGAIYRSGDSGMPSPSFQYVAPPYSPAEAFAAPFFTRLTMDPNNSHVLYTMNTRVWKTTDRGVSWAPLPTTTTGGPPWDPGASFINSIAVSRSNSQIIVVSKGSNILRSTNGGTSWTTVLSSMLGEVANVEIDPGNPSVFYIAAPGWNGLAFVGKFYATTDGGSSWSQRGTGLPAAAIQIVRVDPIDTNTLYCGNDVGVYRSTDQGMTWARFGTGLPSVSVHDLAVARDGSVLRAASYGRGVWELPLRSIPEVGISGLVSSPGGQGLSNVTLTLRVNGNQVASRSTDGSGAYSFGNLALGVGYTVTPSRASHQFNPPAFNVANLGSNQTANFTGTLASQLPAAVSYNVTDLDGDAITDLGFYRSGLWGWLESSQGYSFGSSQFFSWGGAGLQAIVADFDGDGKADIAHMVPPSGGQSGAYAILKSSANYSFGAPLFVSAGFPSLGDTPVVGDFDQDGKADPGIWRASQGVWIIPLSSSNYSSFIFTQWGQLGDTPVVEDFDGDGKADIAYYRDGLWAILKSSQSYSFGSAQFFSWGGPGLQPIVGEFDGDFKADPGYIVPPAGGQTAAYAILKSSTGYNFGQALFVSAGFPGLGDTPVVGDFDQDGKADPGIWRESQGVWIIPLSSTNYASYIFNQWGQSADIAFPNSTGRR